MLAQVSPTRVTLCCHHRANFGAGVVVAGGAGRGAGHAALQASLSPKRFHGRIGYECIGLVTENLRIQTTPTVIQPSFITPFAAIFTATVAYTSKLAAFNNIAPVVLALRVKVDFSSTTAPSKVSES